MNFRILWEVLKDMTIQFSKFIGLLFIGALIAQVFIYIVEDLIPYGVEIFVFLFLILIIVSIIRVIHQEYRWKLMEKE